MRSISVSILALILLTPVFAFADTTNQPIGAGCLFGTDCSSGYCDGATGKCQANPQSPARQPIGARCLYNSECDSNNCSWINGCEASTNTQYIPGTTGANGRSSGSNISQGGGINIPLLERYKDDILDFINFIVLDILFAVAFIVFIYGVYKYFIKGADSDTERKTGRQFVLWGVIGFAIILSIWGLVNVVLSVFNLGPGGAPPTYPTL